MECSNDVEEVNIKKCDVIRKKKLSKSLKRHREDPTFKIVQTKRAFRIKDTDGKMLTIARIPTLNYPRSSIDPNTEKTSRFVQLKKKYIYFLSFFLFFDDTFISKKNVLSPNQFICLKK